MLLDNPEGHERIQYAESLIQTIQPLLVTNGRQKLTAEVFDVDGPLALVKFRFTPGVNGRPQITVTPRQNLRAALDRIADSLDSEMSDQLYTRRHLRLYAGDTFYVVKPAQKRFWSRSAGMADADSVLKDLMGSERG